MTLAAPRLFESLEARTFLSAVVAADENPVLPDLAGEIQSLSLPDVALPREKGSLVLRLRNIGIDDLDEEITIRVYASRGDDTVIDTANDWLLATVRDYRVVFQPGDQRDLKIKIVLPSGITPSDGAGYRILAQIDVDNDVVESREDNNVAGGADPLLVAWRFGTFSGRKNVRLNLTEADGTQATFSLSGSGYGEVAANPAGGWDVRFVNTDEGSKAAFAAKKSGSPDDDGEVLLRSITVGDPADPFDRTSISSISGKKADLLGNLRITGSLRSLDLDDVRPDDEDNPVQRLFSIGAGRTSGIIKFSFDRVLDLNITSGTGIREVKANLWRDAATPNDLITSPSPVRLKIKNGDFPGVIIDD